MPRGATAPPRRWLTALPFRVVTWVSDALPICVALDPKSLERETPQEWRMDVALGRLRRTREVGELIASLLSQRAGYLNGSLLNIDGGTIF